MKPTFMGMPGKRGVSTRTSINSVELGWTRSWKPCGEVQLSPSAASGEKAGSWGRIWDPQEGCGHQSQSRCCWGWGWLSSPAAGTWWPWGGWLSASRKGWWFGYEEQEQRLYFIANKKTRFEGREYSCKCSALWQKHGESQNNLVGRGWGPSPTQGVWLGTAHLLTRCEKKTWQLQGRDRETNL